MMDDSKKQESFVYGADEPKSKAHTGRFSSQNSQNSSNDSQMSNNSKKRATAKNLKKPRDKS